MPGWKKSLSLCVKLFNFFPDWILIRLTWNLSRFVSNSLETLKLNFNRKSFWEFFFKKFGPSKAIFPDFLNLTLVSAIFSDLILHWKILKKYIWQGETRMFYFGKASFPTLFPLGLGLIPLNFDMKFVLDFIIVSIELWERFQPQIRSTWFAIKNLFIVAKAERKVRLCVWNCFIFFPTEYSFVWPEICRVFSQILSELLHIISAENCFGKILQKFWALQSYILFPYF